MLVVAVAALSRAALCQLIEDEPGMRVVACLEGDPREVVKACLIEHPTVIVCDVGESRAGELHLVRLLSNELASVGIVAVVGTRDEQAAGLFGLGAAGVVSWECSDRELVNAVRAVAAGHLFASHSVMRKLVLAAASRLGGGCDVISTLTPREAGVVRLLLEGLSNQEIAGRLHLAEPTVKSHLGRVMTKWGARDRVQVALRALGADHSSRPRALAQSINTKV